MAEQSFKNHTRWHAPFSFFFMPVAALLFIRCMVEFYRHPDALHLTLLVMAVLIFLAGALSRFYALKNQNRLIRLEERVRLHRLMPNEPTLVESLTIPQAIALRFASDGEVADLARRAIRQNLSPKQIKEAVSLWRPDYERV